MMFTLNESEKSLLQHAAQNAVLMEALKKSFLNSFLMERSEDKVHELAAARLAIHFLERAIKELPIAKVEKKEESNINPAL